MANGILILLINYTILYLFKKMDAKIPQCRGHRFRARFYRIYIMYIVHSCIQNIIYYIFPHVK